ncbi:MAG TPA: cytochrome c oxidase subunit II [Acidimicrobiia bacterium]|nr:cytochrome c oxidase subunit II [Acidimicrobiia bacterium]
MAPIRRRLIQIAALVGSAFLISACSVLEGGEDQPLTTFEPAGPFAEQIDGLFWLVFWIATGVFVLVMGGLVLILFVFRDRRKDDQSEPKQLHGSPKLEVLWTVIPALILAGIAVPTVSSIFDLTECSSDAMEVEIIGHQWWFEFYYPEQDVTTANIMVIPVDREVCALMTSDDVLHNFWVPALNGKRYLVPGQTTSLRLQSDEVAEFWGHCAEFCGLSHSLMRTRVQAVSQADFDQWVVDQQAPAMTPVEGEPGFEGWTVFQNKGCIRCHTVRFEDEELSNIIPFEQFHGPDLTHFASRDHFAGAVLPEEGETHDEALKRWLADPPEVKPGSFMPNLALTEQEIDALIVWLDSNQ